MAVLVVVGIAVAVAQAETMPGSSESLRLAASEPRQVGTAMTVTVEGVADGAHRLFVYGQSGAGGCAVEHVDVLQQTALTPAEGESLVEGPFERQYEAVPSAEGRYIVCAYLDAPPARFPDALEIGCFQVPSGYCYAPTLSLAGVLAAEEMGRKVVAEEQQQRSEREARERLAAEEGARAAGRRQEELKAQQAADCHVPRVLGHSVAAAKRLLVAGHCRLGHVTVRTGARKPLRVFWQHPGRGGNYAPGTAVAVRLA